MISATSAKARYAAGGRAVICVPEFGRGTGVERAFAINARGAWSSGDPMSDRWLSLVDPPKQRVFSRHLLGLDTRRTSGRDPFLSSDERGITGSVDHRRGDESLVELWLAVAVRGDQSVRIFPHVGEIRARQMEQFRPSKAVITAPFTPDPQTGQTVRLPGQLASAFSWLVSSLASLNNFEARRFVPACRWICEARHCPGAGRCTR